MSTHLALPLRLGPDGSLASLAVDSAGEIGQSVAVVLATEIGERRSEPLYGSVSQLYDPVASVDADTSAVARWEPRATPDLVNPTATGDPSTPAT